MHIILRIITIVGLLGLSACGDKDPIVTPEERIRPVKSMQVQAEIMRQARSFPGKVIPTQEVEMAFQVDGQIKQLPIREGQTIKEGSLVAQLDQRDFINEVTARQAEFDKTARDLSRAAALLKSGTVPQATYDQTLAAHDVAKANLDTAKKALDDTTLYAPFAGLVAEKQVENFEFIKAKQEIINLHDISHVDVLIDLPEQDVVFSTKIREHDDPSKIEIPGVLVFPSLPGREYKVKVKEYSTLADAKTQTFRVRLTMPAPSDVNILPGMTATLRLTETNAQKQRFLVPVQAVAIDDQGKNYVWVIDPQSNTVSKRLVKVGQLVGGNIPITEGLTENEHIVTAGVDQLQEGMQVRLQTKEQ